ncbi:MAG TPA: hypothetical protein VJQ54_18925 [Candidatus Sulfotelmatobacter sp.]|nr:hypothetical protein [Candidatus Sulfotelmatobacter sp.]
MIWPSVFTNVVLCGVLFGQTVPSNQAKDSASVASNRANGNVSAEQTVTNDSKRVHPYRPDRFGGRAGTYYKLIWGIDGLSVKSAEQGEMIRFSYQVLDPAKAKMLNDKKIEPSLIDEQTHVKLEVPQMDKVGKLRQTAPPEAGKIYWMLFSNKGGYVKRGDRVSVVIGNFRADGLVVD